MILEGGWSPLPSFLSFDRFLSLRGSSVELMWVRMAKDDMC